VLCGEIGVVAVRAVRHGSGFNCISRNVPCYRMGAATAGVILKLGIGVVIGCTQSGHVPDRRIAMAAAATSASAGKCKGCTLMLVAVEAVPGIVADRTVYRSVITEMIGFGMANLTETVVDAIRILFGYIEAGRCVGEYNWLTIDGSPDTHQVGCAMGIMATGTGVRTNSRNIRAVES